MLCVVYFLALFMCLIITIYFLTTQVCKLPVFFLKRQKTNHLDRLKRFIIKRLVCKPRHGFIRLCVAIFGNTTAIVAIYIGRRNLLL